MGDTTNAKITATQQRLGATAAASIKQMAVEKDFRSLLFLLVGFGFFCWFRKKEVFLRKFLIKKKWKH